MKDEHDLELLIASRFPIIAIETHEETRAIALLKRCAQNLKQGLNTWSVANGLLPGTGGAPIAGTTDPAAALRAVSRLPQPGIQVWMDFHPFLGNPLQKIGPFIGLTLLGGWSLSLVFTFLAAIAAKARQ